MFNPILTSPSIINVWKAQSSLMVKLLLDLAWETRLEILPQLQVFRWFHAWAEERELELIKLSPGREWVCQRVLILSICAQSHQWPDEAIIVSLPPSYYYFMSIPRSRRVSPGCNCLSWDSHLYSVSVFKFKPFL